MMMMTEQLENHNKETVKKNQMGILEFKSRSKIKNSPTGLMAMSEMSKEIISGPEDK